MTQARCPICDKPAAAPHRPFCSQRCAYVDLSQWLNSGYRIPTDEAPMVYESDPDRRRDEPE